MSVGQRRWKVPGQKTKRIGWGFTVVVNGKRIKSYKSEWTREDAQAAEAKARLLIEQPKPQASGITLAQAADRYLLAKARKRSLELDRYWLTRFKAEFGADTPLAALTAGRIAEYKAKRLATVDVRRKDADGQPARLSAASANRPLALLRHLLHLAHDEWEVLQTVPRIKLEPEPQGRLRWLTKEEITRLLTACAKSRNVELHAAVVIAINTGLRRGELLGLTWERIDLSRGAIQLEVTKSGKRREVPLNDESYRALVSLTPKESGRVFRTRTIRKAYENAVQAAKLHDVNFHTLRHTFASWAVMMGRPLLEVKELLGHADMKMTLRYAHLSPGHLRDAVASLAGLTSAAEATPGTLSKAQARAHEVLVAPK